MIDEIDNFVSIPCDKCGTSAAYDPAIVNEVTECFSCACQRLEEAIIDCECGWQGNYFQLDCGDGLTHKFCPECGTERNGANDR